MTDSAVPTADSPTARPADGADKRDGVRIDLADGAGDGRQPREKPDAVDGAGDVLAQQMNARPAPLDGGAPALDARQVGAPPNRRPSAAAATACTPSREAAQVGAAQRNRQVAGDGFEDGLHAPESGFEVVDQRLEAAAGGAAADGAHVRDRVDDARRFVEQAVADAGQANLDRFLKLLHRGPSAPANFSNTVCVAPAESAMRFCSSENFAGLVAGQASTADSASVPPNSSAICWTLPPVARCTSFSTAARPAISAPARRTECQKLLRERRGLTRRIDDRRQRAAQVGNGFGRLDTLLRQHGQRRRAFRWARRPAATVRCGRSRCQIADLDRAVADGAKNTSLTRCT